MTTRNYSTQLARIVEQAIEDNNLQTLEQYWELYQRTGEISNVQAFFFRTEIGRFSGGYGNVAIIGDGLLVDIEVNDSRNTGSLTLRSLDSVVEVMVHAGPLPGLPDSQGASLVVVTEVAGQADAGPHWVATTPGEEDYLLRFAGVLVKEISSRQTCGGR